MDPSKLTVVKLRGELSQRGLDTKGNKATLIERLRAALEEENNDQPQDVTSDTEAHESKDKDTGEKPSESSRPPPRTPSSRSSRSSSTTTTPVKATRSSQRRSTTPVPKLSTVNEKVDATIEEPIIEDPKEEEKAELKKSVEKNDTTVRRPSENEKHDDKPVDLQASEAESPNKAEKEVVDKSPVKEPPKKVEKEETPKKLEKPANVELQKKLEVPKEKGLPENVELSAKKEAEKVEELSKKAPLPQEPTKKVEETPKKTVSESPKKVEECQKKVQEVPKKLETPKKVEKVPEKMEVVEESPKKAVTPEAPKKAETAPEPPEISPKKPMTQESPKKPQPAQENLAKKSVLESPKKPVQEPPKKLLQESPKKPQESPKKPQESPKEPQESPKKPQESPKKPQESSKKPQESPKKPEDQSPKKPEDQSPKKPQESQKEEASPKKAQDLPKETSPKKSQELSKQLEERSAAVGEKSPVKKESCDLEDPQESDKKICKGIEEEKDTKEVEKMEEDGPVVEEEVTEPENEELKMECEDVENPQHESKESKEEHHSSKEDRRSERTDRKRKRSLSPLEERSPPPSKREDEPEIDDTAVLLSWYDSDLNLTINKEGFLSASPMHSDGFAYMWAGARASYGYTCGKVYYEAKINEKCSVSLQDEENPHILRVGWSASGTSLQLGEENFSYCYDSTGKKATNNTFADYGEPFSVDDIVGCYLDFTVGENVTMSFAVNGKDLGVAFTIEKQELGNRPLFPHVLSKNYSFICNFGKDSESWSKEIPEGYVPVGCVDLNDRVSGPKRPSKKEECEMIMMCGLPASGKTVWANKYTAEHPEKLFNILGTSSLIDKMTVMGQPRKENYKGRWDILLEKCTRALSTLVDLASNRRRNYILDQINVYHSAQKRKMRNFSGYQRKAVVIVPTEEEFKARTAKREAANGKDVADISLLEMKANFSAPTAGEIFKTVEWVELAEEEGKKLIQKYNKEGKEAGYGQQPSSKRQRTDRNDSSRDNRESRNSRDSRDHRESRDNRDNRDRRNAYSDRNRSSSWRGSGNSTGWRDRSQRGGSHMRHSGGYAPGAWRGRSGPPLRGLDRRGGDRRSSNDRNRQVSSRQGSGSWGPMSYQGSQQSSSGWGQGSWSGQGQTGWRPQSGWSQQQQWGTWENYQGQDAYGQAAYGQQGYGNGNWNSWNPQYYSQCWGQQTGQTGQTTTTTSATSSQAVSKQ